MNETEPVPLARNPLGWIVLAVLFAYMMFGATTRASSEKPEARVERYTSALKLAMTAYQADDSPVSGVLNGERPDAALRRLEREVAPRHATDAIEAAVWTTVRKQLGESVAPPDLAPLRRDKDYRLFADAYAPGRRTADEAKALAAKLRTRGEASKVAADVVLREAGLPPERPGAPGRGVLVASLLVVSFVLASGVAWVMAVGLGFAGALPSLGPATEARTGGEADALALRAATLFATFVGLSTLASLLIPFGMPPLAAQAFVYLAMLPAVLLVVRRFPGLAEVGLGGRTFGRDVLLGLWAFLLEIPVTLTVALVGARLLSGFPAPEHPAATALSNSPDLWTVVVTFLGGAVVAPFWEETMFRGLFFPALRRVLGGPVSAALLSSFLFASIHPQGPAAWAALASVALFSCVLVQRTRSLVPSITMHFAHNAALLTLALTMGR